MTADATNVLLIATALLFGCASTWLLLNSKIKEQRAAMQEVEARKNVLEKELHVKDRSFLEERNKLELEYLDKAKAEKKVAYEEGRDRGKVEGERANIAALTEAEKAFASRLASDISHAVTEARERLRAEYELQNQLFSVKISPYVRVTEIKDLFSKKYEAEVGYQYQLLVNGIPAFQPHIIIEQKQSKAEIDEQAVREFVAAAGRLVEGAVEMYFGRAVKMAKIGPAVVDKLIKK